ncbi:MAG: PHP domain-containing protein [Thermanaeromonas sp.]|uniref:PHP domain-containing protein n=1 Tax=Thermanaeromonas sp. TaxID=2003697 RepID=UPI00243F3A41|nr:PHP domain-containing protein [Thermanaeromonas sp.]MCG0277478.1 PHP domain-containing protein [Thermanaeromonas sp.]
MRGFIGDLHIHTALSPCAGEQMTPPAIVAQALKAGLDFIAVTDHNSAGNVEAVMEAARGTILKVWPGLEVQTKEEVHLVCLFDSVETALAWQDVVYRHLPPGENIENIWGTQLLLDARGKERGREKRLLLQSTSLSIEEVFRGVSLLEGIVIPAHVDRQAYSLLNVLGFIPPGLPITALEVSRAENLERIRSRTSLPQGFSLIASSDAHYLEDIGQLATCFCMHELTFSELRLALAGEGGRKVVMVQGAGGYFRVVE